MLKQFLLLSIFTFFSLAASGQNAAAATEASQKSDNGSSYELDVKHCHFERQLLACKSEQEAESLLYSNVSQLDFNHQCSTPYTRSGSLLQQVLTRMPGEIGFYRYHQAIVRTLLALGVNPHITGKSYAPLRLAASSNFVPEVKMLLARGVDPKVGILPSHLHVDPFHFRSCECALCAARSNIGSGPLIETFVASGYDITLKLIEYGESFGWSLMHVAECLPNKPKPDFIENLVAFGASPCINISDWSRKGYGPPSDYEKEKNLKTHALAQEQIVRGWERYKQRVAQQLPIQLPFIRSGVEAALSKTPGYEVLHRELLPLINEYAGFFYTPDQRKAILAIE